MLERILEAICAFVLAATVLIAFIAVIFRYVIGAALSWSFEASLALLTYVTFIGCYLALRKQSHLKVDVFVRKLPPFGQGLVFLFNQLTIAAIGCVMLYHGARQVYLYRDQNTLVMEIPVAVLYLAIPLSGLLMGLDALLTLGSGLRRVSRGEPPLDGADSPTRADL